MPICANNSCELLQRLLDILELERLRHAPRQPFLLAQVVHPIQPHHLTELLQLLLAKRLALQHPFDHVAKPIRELIERLRQHLRFLGGEVLGQVQQRWSRGYTEEKREHLVEGRQIRRVLDQCGSQTEAENLAIGRPQFVNRSECISAFGEADAHPAPSQR